ncbi:MAG: serine/threonine dehydratase [Gammaproteobacteria bacterium]|nr:serine/threonine dehydratase [Gammaproteobacteria bacterium]
MLKLTEIRELREQLGGHVDTTPVHRWHSPVVAERLGAGTEVFMKLELFQRTGTFKPRGALSNMLSLGSSDLKNGICAVSAGNHAIAAAYAAKELGTSAKVVMIKTANPFRIERCLHYGAEVEMADNAHVAFERVTQIEQEESRSLVHPFEGHRTALGTATVGMELCDQVAGLDAVIVPIGGGGLCAGVATAVKLMQPDCLVYGVEPEGADTMHRSFAAGSPQSIEQVNTIADSLGAPYAAPYTFELCRDHVDELVMIDDDAMRQAMGLLFHELKLAVEPAGAAATAAMWGPLRTRLQGKRVGVIVCGTNIDAASFSTLIQASPDNS